MKIVHVVGARPNFMKVAPVQAALSQYPGLDQVLVHTGQHYDANMSQVFFEQLGLPQPDANLGIGSGTHAVQTAQVMLAFEQEVLARRPTLVLVYGDINSTLAAALVCAKLGIAVGHVEAGLRSFDRTMPEEINRLLTDQICDLLFTPSADGNANLQREGIPDHKIHLVGNVMIDTLMRLLPQARQCWPALQAEFGLERYALVTLHRPSNVDQAETLVALVAALAEISCALPVVFPVHPRTRQRLQALGEVVPTTVHLTSPLGYLDFLALEQHATMVITDSGGVQEETTYLGVPCLTVRDNTERPITITQGTNTLVGREVARLIAGVGSVLRGEYKPAQVPPLWDGRAGQRIAAIIASDLA